MIIKVSDSRNDMSNEIITLSQCQENRIKYRVNEKRLVPKIYGYGSIKIKNEAGKIKKYIYSVMQRFKMTVQDYLLGQKTIDYLDILDIGM